MVDLLDINNNDPYIINYSIKFLILKTMVVTKESIKSIDVPYIGLISISSED